MSWESEELNVRNGFHFSGNWELFSQQSSGPIPCTRTWNAWTLWKAYHCMLLVQPAVTGCLLCARHQDRAVNKDLP